MAALQNTPRHSHESNHMEFWGEELSDRPALHFCLANSILACHATSLILTEYILIFSHPPFLKLFVILYIFCMYLFSKLSFFSIRYPIPEVFGPKKLPVGPALRYVTQALFWLVTQNF